MSESGKYVGILREMVEDDAFAELCQGIGEEPEWLKKAKVALNELQTEHSHVPEVIP